MANYVNQDPDNARNAPFSEEDEAPIAVDYTSRDFYSLRNDLTVRIQDRLPSWQGEDPSDFGVALVEAFSYMGDVINYYIDRVANESYLPTATQRQSVLNIARNYGYQPTGFRAATVDIAFTNTSEDQVILPAGTELQTSVDLGDITVDLIYTIPTSTTVPGAVGESVGETTAVAENYEDISKRPENAATGVNDIDGELLAVSNGLPEQRYRLSESQVIDGSVEVFVQTGDLFEPWLKVDNLVDFGRFDSVYEVETDAEGFVFVQFGDGVSGAIPNKFSVIKAVYKVGGGTVGNIQPNLITEFFRIPGLNDAEVAALSDTLTLSNPSKGVGGEAPESIESIKENAPKALTALNRAVSLKDFESLALRAPDAGKAKAISELWTSVTLYVSPQRNPASVDQFPGYSDNPNSGGSLLPEWNDLQANVSELLQDKLLLGTSLTIVPPTYVEASVELVYTKFEQFQEVTLETEMLKGLLDLFSYNNSNFNQIIHPEEIESFIRSIRGVRNASVTGLYRTESGSGRNILIGEPDEIFVFLSDNIVLTRLSSVATLSNLTATPGTFAPTFVPDFFNYSLTVPNGTTQISVTPTLSVNSSTLRVNGTEVTSGDPQTITIQVGTTQVAISIQAADGITFNDYTLTVTRNA